MSEFLMAIGAIVCGCVILLSLLYVLTFTLNIILNKNLPFYKDFFEWVKPREEFYKHRVACKSCKIDYQKNRYHDIKDGKCDMVSWYNKTQEMKNERIIEHLNKIMLERNNTTHTMFVPERELRNTSDYNDSRETRYVCYFFFLLPVLIIIFVILKDLGVI